LRPARQLRIIHRFRRRSPDLVRNDHRAAAGEHLAMRPPSL
jgi:hypothetical protein